jgi:arginase
MRIQPATGRQRVDLIGAPFNSAGKADGVAGAPGALRRAGLGEALTGAGFTVADRGDLEMAPMTPARDLISGVIASAALAHMIRSVRQVVGASIAAGAFPLVLGGDCPVLIGCLGAAATHGAARVLFVDGHEDAWPADRSTTGEAADMELGWLLGRALEDLPAHLREEIPEVKPDDVIVLGARDEQELADAGVESIGDLVRIVRPPSIAEDPAAVADEAVVALSARGPWWLHVDLDVLSTESLAAVDYPQAGGLDWPALADVTQRALASPDVLGWTVTIYNPELDPQGAAAARIVRYVVESL